jgi:3-phenylpropionate/trans-cinnamate dioxygenase ferredoxin reductase component
MTVGSGPSQHHAGAFDGSVYVIVGGGHAGAAAVRELMAHGYSGRVLLLAIEDRLPYDRTTLSKTAVLAGSANAPPELWQDDESWTDKIDVRLRTAVSSLDLKARKLQTASGEVIGFDKLLLATGAEPRRLSIPGTDVAGVHYLRDAVDAAAVRHSLSQPGRLVIIGGGVIGLEVAATANGLGHKVTVIEAAPRLLGRGVPAEVAAFLCDIHAEHDVQLRTGVLPEQIRYDDGRVTGVRLATGEDLPAEVVVIGVGVRPRDELAAEAGLDVDDGILVDAAGRTSEPDVFAAGDAVRMRHSPDTAGIRLESWQPAGRQAVVAARAMLGMDEVYADQPWTWSDQYDFMMQSVGIAPAGAQSLVCGPPGTDAILVLSIADDRIVAACGAARGAGIAKPIRAVRLLLEHSGPADIDAIRDCAGNLKAVTRLLMLSART